MEWTRRQKGLRAPVRDAPRTISIAPQNDISPCHVQHVRDPSPHKASIGISISDARGDQSRNQSLESKPADIAPRQTSARRKEAEKQEKEANEREVEGKGETKGETKREKARTSPWEKCRSPTDRLAPGTNTGK